MLLNKLLNIRPGELARLFPFFGLYLLLFGALTLADGFTLALFVQRVGKEFLPLAYGCIGAANFVLVAWYFFRADGASSTRVFVWIVGVAAAVFVLAWLGIWLFKHNGHWFSVLFVSREIALTMVLLHFGTFLQDYFTRDEMNRVLPVIYSGGRVGGIVGAALLSNLSPRLGLINLCVVVAGMLLAGLIALAGIRRTQYPLTSAQEETEELDASSTFQERAARYTLTGFLRFAWRSPLLFWLTFTSILFMTCRWLLNYEYNAFFSQHFDHNALDMARFLGDYTQLALIISLVLQLFVVNRLITRFGLRATHVAYSALMAGALVANLLPMTLGLAIFDRFIETELRFGLRNPIMQLITNRFSKPLRTRVRSWTMGVLTPVSTLLASGLLSGLLVIGLVALIPLAGAVMAVAFLVGSVLLSRCLPKKKLPAPILAQTLHKQVAASEQGALAA